MDLPIWVYALLGCTVLAGICVLYFMALHRMADSHARLAVAAERIAQALEDRAHYSNHREGDGKNRHDAAEDERLGFCPSLTSSGAPCGLPNADFCPPRLASLGHRRRTFAQLGNVRVETTEGGDPVFELAHRPLARTGGRVGVEQEGATC